MFGRDFGRKESGGSEPRKKPITAAVSRTRFISARKAHAAKKLGLSLILCCCAAAQSTVQPTAPDPANTALPVRTLHGYLMVVGVSINDQGPFDFLIDTGTNTTLLDPQLAAELNLRPKDRLRLDSLSSSAGVPRFFLQKLQLGPAALSNLEALAVPLTQLTALDRHIRGILGMNFLLNFSFRLDYDRGAMEIYPFPETAHIPSGLRVPVQINQARLLIAVASSAAPHGTWRLALDSGISQLLIFQDRMGTPSQNAESPRNASHVMQVATNLSQQSASTRVLRDVSISDTRLPDQEVVVLRNELLKPTDPQDGLLPAAPFHSVFFDRTNATVILGLSPDAVSLAALEPK